MSVEFVDVAQPLEVVLPEVLLNAATWCDGGRRGMHCGSGGNLLDGWLNTDMVRLRDPSGKTTRIGALYRCGRALYFEHDATTPFPLPKEFFDVIFSEHFIEHIPYDAAKKWAAEMYRMLKPGGRIRVSTPSLKLYVDGYADPEQKFFRKHAELIRPVVPELVERRGWMLNQIFYAWSHRYIYDYEELSHTLHFGGFDSAKITEHTFRTGGDLHLAARDLESRADESLYVEALK